MNVLVFGEEIVGDNTDVHGLTHALKDLDVDLGGRRVLVLGAGGAGRAAVYALRLQGAEVSVANRTSAARGGARSPGRGVTSRRRGPSGVQHPRPHDLGGDRPWRELLDDTTLEPLLRVGWSPSSMSCTRPDETQLVHAARAAGVKASDGLRMLVHQAGEAWRLFFGDVAPLDVMHVAAARTAGRQS